jgi:hypothetical protein
MKYIANIVSKSKKYKFNEFINTVNSIDKIDVSVPTLIVGTEMVKSIYGENINYINRQIDENTFWTYSTVERRSENERDIEKFQSFILKILKKTIKYTFFSVLTCKKYEIKKLLMFLNNRDDVFYLFTNKMLYISYDNDVIGISLDECSYIGVKTEKIFKKISSITKNVDSFLRIQTKIGENFIKNDEILTSAMFCYLNR